MYLIESISSTWNYTWDYFLPPQLEPLREKSQQAYESLSNGLQFLQRFIQSPTTVGSLIPSSPYLAGTIVSLITYPQDDVGGKNYLEVGPGTGPFTQEIVKKLATNDHLDVVEIDPIFCEILRKKYSDRRNVQVHCESIENWHPDYSYDAIISGLPLNSFAPEMVQIFINTFKSLTRENGTVSYFEYALLPKIKIQTLLGDKRDRFQKVLDIKNEFFKNFGIMSETVYRNLPPAKVLHFRISKTDAPPTVPPISNTP